MKQKRIVRLTESKLNRIIKKVLREGTEEYSESGAFSTAFDLVEELKQTMSVDDILARLISRIGAYPAEQYLKDIKNAETDNEEVDDEDLEETVRRRKSRLLRR